MTYQDTWTLDATVGHWTLDSGRWTFYAGLWTLDSEWWTLDVGLWRLGSELRRWMLDAVARRSGQLTLLSTGSEQNQNPVSGSAYSIENISSNVAIFRNSILTLNVSFHG